MLASVLRVGLLTTVLAACLLAGCEQQPRTVKFSGATMGTSYSVTIAEVPPELKTKQIKADVEQVLDTVNQRMSTYREDSELSRVNSHAAGAWVPISEPLLALIKRASDINLQSQGAFDITVGPLVNLWGFGPGKHVKSAPSDAQITERLRLLGFDKFILRDRPPAINKRIDEVYIDLSAIAKGYGVDQVTAKLKQLGLSRFLVEIGGELYGEGFNPDGKAWQVAVERPTQGARNIELIVNLQGRGMATSGGYRNFFEADGKRYSHTIDPRTGRPVTHNLRSVTVLAAYTADADALATALLVMGPKDGLAFAEREKIAALFISGANDEYTEHMTKQFSAHVSEQP